MRRRRMVSRGTRRPRRKVVFARYITTLSNQTAGTAITFVPLADFETEYGAQLLGATIVRIRGTITVRNRGQVTASPLADFAYGLMVSDIQVQDMAAQHPNPGFQTANNDRFASWMWIESFHIPTPIATVVGDAALNPWVQRDFDVRAKRVLRQLEDQLILGIWPGTAATNNLDIGIAMSIAVALP